jgi:uncharacterized protein (DUF1015 family)
MALIYPFQGFRYNRQIVEDLNLVVTQPYDKTTPQMQQEYYRRSPYNVVRITLNLEKNEDPKTRYPEAGTAFRRWIDQKVLVQDPLPAIYAYYQEYVIEGQKRMQRGFIALLDLKSSASGIIPHERTLDAPKQDRLQLMRSLEGNDDVIYMLYGDDTLRVNHIMDREISARPPEMEVRDEYEAIHRIWSITDPGALEGIQNAMLDQRLFIADGHHRFETSVNFMNECEGQNWKPDGIESFDKRMVTCFNSTDGVTILPTHRLIRDLPSFNASGFVKQIKQHFEVEPVQSAELLWKTMEEDRGNNVFGFYSANPKQFCLLRLKEQMSEDPLLLKHSKPYRQLDVSILHALLLERHLGIDENKLAAQSHVDYARERAYCIRMIDEGQYQAAFFLNPTPAEQMQRVASLGERMPQKSTDFFPKLLTGLVFMKMKIRKD